LKIRPHRIFLDASSLHPLHTFPKNPLQVRSQAQQAKQINKHAVLKNLKRKHGTFRQSIIFNRKHITTENNRNYDSIDGTQTFQGIEYCLEFDLIGGRA
jgi:hypothetical protein